MRKSKQPGKTTLDCEVVNISPFGLWILFRGQEYYLNHLDFPWFQEARVADVMQVQALSSKHLRWPKLDIDLHLEAIVAPSQYPLLSGRLLNRPSTKVKPNRSRAVA